jgi:hypothetical protein
MPTRPRGLPSKVLACLALAAASFALPASCAEPEGVAPSELVGSLAESATELRDAFDEHRRWYSAVDLDVALPRLERDEARRLRGEISELLESLYALDSCQKEGWSRETVYISDLIGQLEGAIDVHVRQVSDVESQLELRVEEGVYAIKVGDLLDELDQHIEAAKVEADQRPRLRCGHAPAPKPRRRNVPLI